MSLTTNLAAYWELNEESGIRADAHSDNDLTDNNTVLFAAGKQGNAADFEADNSESLTIVDNAEISLGADEPFTVCFWFKPETTVNSACVAAKAVSDTTTTSEWRFFFWSNEIRFQVADGTNQQAVIGPELTPGTWYFIQGWHDPVANEVAIKVDAAGADTEAYAHGTQDTAGVLAIGKQGGHNGNYADGLIDEFGLWIGEVLDATKLTWLYNSGNGRTYSDIVGYGVVGNPWYAYAQQ